MLNCANPFSKLVQALLGWYLPPPDEYKLEDVANVYMVERVEGEKLSCQSAVEVTGGSRLVLAPYHAMSSHEQQAEKKVLEAIKSFLHLVKVDYS